MARHIILAVLSVTCILPALSAEPLRPGPGRGIDRRLGMREQVEAERQLQIVFNAAPTTGRAPLGVQFYATGGATYRIDFGDGETGAMASPCDPGAASGHSTGQSACPPPTAYHIYRTEGSYTAVLRPSGACATDTACPPPAPLATVQINVSGTETPTGIR